MSPCDWALLFRLGFSSAWRDRLDIWIRAAVDSALGSASREGTDGCDWAVTWTRAWREREGSETESGGGPHTAFGCCCSSSGVRHTRTSGWALKVTRAWESERDRESCVSGGGPHLELGDDLESRVDDTVAPDSSVAAPAREEREERKKKKTEKERKTERKRKRRKENKTKNEKKNGKIRNRIFGKRY